MFCSNCGREVSEDARVCDNCGECILPPPDETEAFCTKDGQDVFCNEEHVINKQNKPLSMLGFLAMQIALLIPVVGFILMFIWSFGRNTNANRKAYARSILVWLLVFCVVILFVILTFMFMGYPISINSIIRSLKGVVSSIPE